MPRRNERPASPEPLTITPADLAKSLRKPPMQRKPPPELSPQQIAARRKRVLRSGQVTCLMPECGNPSIRGRDGCFGICHGCALDVVIHYERLQEETPELTEARLQRELKRLAHEEREGREAATRAITPGWIYYLRVDDRIKIGYSIDVRQRMRQYPPTSVLLAVHPGTMTLEHEIHAEFSGHLAQGREWFRPDPEVLARIDEVVEQFGPPPKAFIYRFREGTPQQMKLHRRTRTPARRRTT